MTCIVSNANIMIIEYACTVVTVTIHATVLSILTQHRKEKYDTLYI